jgi:CheY-like chemotaxis protein
VGTTFTAELAGAEAPWAGSVGPEEMAADTGPPRPRATVLYIEDNLANLRLVERIIARRPELTLISAMLGGQGLELARSHLPQAIILDLHLPDMFGGEVLARLHEDSRTSDIPVVILSADATPGQIARLLAQGAHAYLTKPLDVAHLLACLDNLFARRESHAE